MDPAALETMNCSRTSLSSYDNWVLTGSTHEMLLQTLYASYNPFRQLGRYRDTKASNTPFWPLPSSKMTALVPWGSHVCYMRNAKHWILSCLQEYKIFLSLIRRQIGVEMLRVETRGHTVSRGNTMRTPDGDMIFYRTQWKKFIVPSFYCIPVFLEFIRISPGVAARSSIGPWP